MSNINCGIGVLHVKRQILTYFFVMSFICSLKFLLFQLIGHTKKCLQKNLKIVYDSVFVIWLYLQKAMYRPCDIDLWPMKDNFFSELIATLLVRKQNWNFTYPLNFFSRSCQPYYFFNLYIFTLKNNGWHSGKWLVWSIWRTFQNGRQNV